jgi:hypothetical protein
MPSKRIATSAENQTRKSGLDFQQALQFLGSNNFLKRILDGEARIFVSPSFHAVQKLPMKIMSSCVALRLL